MVAAVVILYHPNHDLLNSLIKSLNTQVDFIFMVDNTPTSNRNFESPLAKNTRYIPLGKNLGIARAQNIGIELARENACTHIILFDQDSIPPENMISDLITAEQKLLSTGKKVAAIGPLYYDRIKNVYGTAQKMGIVTTKRTNLNPGNTPPIASDLIVASGSLIRLSVIEEVGFMLDKFFIDCVDTEWCIRAKSKGFQPYILPTTVMSHALGDSYVKLIGKRITVHSHNRNFYYIRNICYLLKQKQPSLSWKIQHALKIPIYMMLYSWYSSKSPTQRYKNFLSLLYAAKKGIFDRLGPI